MRLTYQEILAKLRTSTNFQSFVDDDNLRIAYFEDVEISHPESITVYKNENKQLVILEHTRDYSGDKNRGHPIYLGSGGEGVVTLARNVETGQFLAVKHTLSNGTHIKNAYSFAEKFQTGVDSLIKLHVHGPHPDKKKYQYFSVMDLGMCELAELNRPLTKSEKLKIISQIINFTRKLAEQGYYFSDYKSRNILLNSNMEIKVCDLEGFSRSTHHSPLAFYLYEMIGFLYGDNFPYNTELDKKWRSLYRQFVKELVNKFESFTSERADEFYSEIYQYISTTIEEFDLMAANVTRSTNTKTKKSALDRVGEYSPVQIFYVEVDHLFYKFENNLEAKDLAMARQCFYEIMAKPNQNDSLLTQGKEQKALRAHIQTKLKELLEPKEIEKKNEYLSNILSWIFKQKDDQWLRALWDNEINISQHFKDKSIIRQSFEQNDETFTINVIDMVIKRKSNNEMQKWVLNEFFAQSSLMMLALENNNRNLALKILDLTKQYYLITHVDDALKYAIDNKITWFVSACLEDPNYQVNNDTLQYAINKNKTWFVSACLKDPRQCDFTSNYFNNVVITGNLKMAEIFAQHVDIQKESHINNKYCSPLSIAIEQNDTEMVMLLLEHSNGRPLISDHINPLKLALENDKKIRNNEMLYQILKHTKLDELSKVFNRTGDEYKSWTQSKKPLLADLALRELESLKSKEDKIDFLQAILDKNSALYDIFAKHKNKLGVNLFLKSNNSRNLKISKDSHTILKFEALLAELKENNNVVRSQKTIPGLE